SWRVAPTSRIALAGLDPPAVAEFVEAFAGTSLDAAGEQFAVAVHEHTAGNPFFVNELVRNRFETTPPADALVAGGNGHDFTLTPGLRDVVMRRVGRLPPVAQHVLTMATVVGLEFDARVVQRAADVDIAALLQALEDATGAALLDELGPNQFAFAHALVRQALYDRMSATRGAWLHGQVGNAIEAVHHDHLDEHL